MDFEEIILAASHDLHDELGGAVEYFYKAEGVRDSIPSGVIFAFNATTIIADGGLATISRKPVCDFERDVLARKPKRGDQIIRRNCIYEITSVESKRDGGWICNLLLNNDTSAEKIRDKT